MFICYYKMLIDAYWFLLNERLYLNVKLFDCDVYMFKCNCCVLLSESIHVLMHLVCWIYSHPLLHCTLAWYRYTWRRNLVAMSLRGWRWSLLLLSFFITFGSLSRVEALISNTGESFYFKFCFRIHLWIQCWCWYNDMIITLMFENYSAATFLI